MTIHIALLRAINLKDHNRVAMADLRALATDLGFHDVRTILQSGNLVYRTTLSTPSAESVLEDATKRHLGVDTDFIVRTSTRWRAIIEANPFRSEARRDPGHLVLMACKKPVGADLAITGGVREKVKPAGKEIYIYYPDGIGRSRLKVSARGTARNWNTVLKLAALLDP